MRFEVDAKTFCQLLKLAQKAVPRRSYKALLLNIKLTLGPTAGTMVANDLEVGLVIDVPCRGEGEFTCLVNPAQLVQVLGKAKGLICLDTFPDRIEVLVGAARLSVACNTAAELDEFPDVPATTEDHCYIARSSHLRESIKHTVFSADIESTRYSLGAIAFDVKADEIVLAATDSSRLAVHPTPITRVKDPDDPSDPMLVPQKTAKLLLAMMPEDKPVLIQPQLKEADKKLDAVACSFVFDGGRIHTRTCERRFPRYAEVVPRSCLYDAKVPPTPLIEALRMASKNTHPEARGIDFIFDGRTLALEWLSASAQTGRAEVPAKCMFTDTVTVTLDPKFIIDFLAVVDPNGLVDFGMGPTGNEAVLIRYGVAKYVVMPLARAESAEER